MVTEKVDVVKTKDVVAMVVTTIVVVTAMAVEVNMIELVVVTEKETVDLKYLICGGSGGSGGGYIFDGGGWSRCGGDYGGDC